MYPYPGKPWKFWLHQITGRRELVFFSAANESKLISNNAVLSALRRMGYAGRMTGHGFRSLASTILNEQRKYHPDIIERQLAHTDRNEVRAVYNRADYLLEGKKMMQEWSDFLDAVVNDEGRVVQGDIGGSRAIFLNEVRNDTLRQTGLYERPFRVSGFSPERLPSFLNVFSSILCPSDVFNNFV